MTVPFPLPTAVWLTLGVGIVSLLGVDSGSPAARNEVMIAEVASQMRTTADASWWGFNVVDATDVLQGAIDSGARRVVVPMMAGPWVIRPLKLKGDLELEFQPGVLVLAKQGEFRGGGDSLFRAVDCTNIVIRGYGATLRMRKKDYQNPPYPKAEWRMGLSFIGCRNVVVEGLRVESTGGDGIYIGSSQANRWCEDVTIRNCVCQDNHRQGVSVISAVNLLVENCAFSQTEGTPPAAGIDLEPDEPDERLVNCVVRNCVFDGNTGSAMLVYLKPLTRASQPVSIRFENCHARVGKGGATIKDVAEADLRAGSGIAVGKVRDQGPTGLIEFVNCTSENTGREAVRIFDKSSDGVRLRFERCRWKNSWTSRHQDYGGPRVPILIRREELDFANTIGGIEFIECHVIDSINGATVRYEDDDSHGTLRDVAGTIRVQNPRGVRTQFGPNITNVTLRLVSVGRE